MQLILSIILSLYLQVQYVRCGRGNYREATIATIIPSPVVKTDWQETMLISSIYLLPVFLFFLAFGSSALCGDDKDFCTPAKKLRKEPLFLSRTLKIEKRKSRTLAARAEICRRRLFKVESENSSPTSTIEPRVLRERKESPQISTQISVS